MVLSTTTPHEDGTVDIVQSSDAARRATPEELERLYWHELARTTFGLARFSRDAVRVLGVWPALLRFGPLTEGRRAIVGGIFARRPHGVISWSCDGSQVTVAVLHFAPLLRGPFWRLESWFHGIVGRRFLHRASERGA